MVVIYIGIPNLLVRGPEWFINVRLSGQTAAKAAGNTVPYGYSASLAYLNALGLPLTIATVAGLLLSLRRAVTTNGHNTAAVILFAGLAAYLLVFLGFWTDFRTHHVLPSIPLLMLPFGATLSWYLDRKNNVARVVFVVVLLTTAVYAGAGLLQFTDDARDEAADWLETEGNTDATIAVFERSPAKLGLVHGQPIDHYQFGSETEPGDPYTEWIISTPDRQPEYIQLSKSIQNMDEYPRRAAFYTRLTEGDHYGYVVAAEFGERTEPRTRQQELLYAGIEPKIEKRTSYVVIYAKNESLA
jgi:type III secretory pathway component EscS